MGEMRNGRAANLIAGSTSAIMIVLTVVLVWESVKG
jgi:hypothetical protein